MTASFCSFPGVTGFTLCPNGEDQNGVEQGQISVKRNISARAATNEQLAPAIAGRTSDERIVGEHIKCAYDFSCPGVGIFDFMALQMAHDSIEIIDHAGRQPDARHRSSLRATGRFTGFPASRALR